MDSKICLLTLKNAARLEKLIQEGASPEKILHQSQLLDKYISIQMQHINSKKGS